MTKMLISNRAVISQKENKAALQFSEPCDRVTAVEPCNVKIYGDGTYYIEIDETKEPSYLSHEIPYFEELD